MAKKKTSTESSLVSEYMNYVVEHNKQPESVYSFTKSIGITEKEFYTHFGSFTSLQKTVFTQFFNFTIDLLHKDEDYGNYDAKSKLISFYYTIFELFKANRSYIAFVLTEDKNQLKNYKQLADFNAKFEEYIDTLSIKLPDLQIEKIEAYKEKGVAKISWAQFLFILKFWLEDESANFEKTDVLIEKSITTGFNIIENNPLKHIIDLGKFLIKEKTHFSL